MTRRVAVTGIGMVTPLGNTAEASWQKALQGGSGIDYITRFDTTGFPIKIAGEVRHFDASPWYANKKNVKRSHDYIHYALAASRMALSDSGLVIDQHNTYSIGICMGTGGGGLVPFEKEVVKLYRNGLKTVDIYAILKFIPNMAGSWISSELGIKGPIYTTSCACATSTQSLILAADLIRSGRISAAVAGGTEAPLSPMGVGCYDRIKALTTAFNTNPQAASRPFDRQRSGFVIGEGAGVMILEDLDAARRRGAPVYAELAGYGEASDAFHPTQPDPSGKGFEKALQDATACIDRQDIGYINAHGTSTVLGDRTETQSLKNVFGPLSYRIPISSTKSMTGHLLGAAGSVEAIFTVLALRDAIIPPTINYEVPDELCDLDYTPNRAVRRTINTALSNSIGFGGHNACLAFKKIDPAASCRAPGPAVT